MATTTDTGAGVQMIALDRIRTDANVRELASGDVDALAGSIALLGVPLSRHGGASPPAVNEIGRGSRI